MVNPELRSEEGFVVVGFVGDHRGDKGSIAFHRPVVKRNGEVLAAVSDDWGSNTDLVQVGDHEPYTRLPSAAVGKKEPSFVGILPGQGIWLAGQIFVNRCVDIGADGVALRLWPEFGSEFVYRIGTRREFVEFSNKLFHAAALQMVQALGSPDEYRSGVSTIAFEVLNNLHEVDAREQALQRAIYYSERSDLYSRDLVALDVVRDGLVESRASFIAEVDDARQLLHQRKLRDAIGGSRPQGVERLGLGDARAMSMRGMRAMMRAYNDEYFRMPVATLRDAATSRDPSVGRDWTLLVAELALRNGLAEVLGEVDSTEIAGTPYGQ